MVSLCNSCGCCLRKSGVRWCYTTLQAAASPGTACTAVSDVKITTRQSARNALYMAARYLRLASKQLGDVDTTTGHESIISEME